MSDENLVNPAIEELSEASAAMLDVAELLGPRADPPYAVLTTVRQLLEELEESGELIGMFPLGSILDAARDLKIAARAARERGGVNDAVDDTLADAGQRLEEHTERLLEILLGLPEPGGVNVEAYRRALMAARERLAIQRLVRDTRGAREEIAETLKETRQAAGAIGENVVATEFGRFARQERFSANVFRGACIATLVAVIALAAVLLFAKGSGNLTTAKELARLAITVPVGVLAAYLGREAARHRAASRWARVLEVQLLSIDAYSRSLPEADRHRLRFDFGHRAFLTGAAFEDRNDTNTPSVVTDAGALLGHVGGLVDTIRGGGATKDG